MNPNPQPLCREEREYIQGYACYDGAAGEIHTRYEATCVALEKERDETLEQARLLNHLATKRLGEAHVLRATLAQYEAALRDARNALQVSRPFYFVRMNICKSRDAYDQAITALAAAKALLEPKP